MSLEGFEDVAPELLTISLLAVLFFVFLVTVLVIYFLF